MSNTLDTPYTSICVFLQSADADITETQSNRTFFLDSIIQPPENCNMLISLTDFEMPKSFYTIVQGVNDSLSFATGTGTYDLIFKTGNYSAEQIVNYTNASMASASIILGGEVVVKFEEQEGKFDWTCLDLATGAVIAFNITETNMYKELGLGIDNLLLPQIPTTFQALPYRAKNLADLSGEPNIYIRIPNLDILNEDSRGGQNGTIGKVNVRVNWAEYIFLSGSIVENIYFKLGDKFLNKFQVVLEDSKGNGMVLNGGIWSLTLTIHFQYKRTPRDLREYTIQHSLQQQINQDTPKPEDIKTEEIQQDEKTAVAKTPPKTELVDAD